MSLWLFEVNIEHLLQQEGVLGHVVGREKTTKGSNVRFKDRDGVVLLHKWTIAEALVGQSGTKTYRVPRELLFQSISRRDVHIFQAHNQHGTQRVNNR